MTIDVKLCAEYLGMPESHWTLAAQTAEWIEGDVIARRLVVDALDAMDRGSRDAAGAAARALKAHVKLVAPELTEGANPMIFALALPQTLKNMRAAGVPEAIIRDTVSDYGVWARFYEELTGKVGIGETGWEMNFHTGRIVKLGRVQFETCSFHGPYVIYRRRDTGEIIPAVLNGCGVDANGFLADEGSPASAVFTAQMTVENGVLRVNRIDTVSARILPEMVEYPMADLEPLLMEGMRVLNMHIPDVGPLKVDEVADSLAMAREYFTAKGYPCDVAVCESWLLDPALLIYGEGCGNILSFQQRFAKFPWPTTESDAVNRVFGRGTDLTDLSALPETTRLQRGLKAYLHSGAPLRDAGGVLTV